MRIPGWVFAVLLLGACDKDGLEESVTPEVRDTPRAREVSEARIVDLQRCEVVGPGEMGSVNYRMVVSASGRVESVRAEQSPVSAAVINCSVQRARAWRFPANDGPTELSFSVSFGASQLVETARGRASKSPGTKPPKHRTSELQHCYNTALKGETNLQGTIRFAMVIDVKGHVTSVDADPDPSIPPAMVACSIEKIQGWEFPMGDAEVGADVSFSVVFSPSSTTPPAPNELKGSATATPAAPSRAAASSRAEDPSPRAPGPPPGC